MILMAYRYGLRASEVCRLMLTDVDLKGRTIRCARLKNSLDQIQPLYPHAGQPLLDELAASRLAPRSQG